MGLALTAYGQTKKVPCYVGDPYPSCTPSERLAKADILARARTAAIIIDVTQGIACGDGSDGCFRTDDRAVAIIESEAEESDLWQNFIKTEPKKADVLLQFRMRDRQSLTLCVYNAATNNVLWCDYRSPSIALDNDAARSITHLLEARRKK
jgi:hypothetical protein